MLYVDESLTSRRKCSPQIAKIKEDFEAISG